MNRLVVLLLVVTALAGCAQHQHTPTKAQQQAQASQNALNNALSGGPLTSHAPSLADYSLSGYGTSPKK